MKNLQRWQHLDLNLLRIFQALYYEQNMTRAAELLNITPSAVSHAVKRLRDTLDDPLFRRSQNKMLPTPVCQRMAPQIIESLHQLQQLVQQWGDFDPATSEHRFRIGMHDALELAVLPRLAARLAAEAPKVTFSSVKLNRADLALELASGHLDVALDVPLSMGAPVRQKKLIDNDFVVMMRRDHPTRGQLSQQNYLSASHLSVSNRSSGMAIEDMLFSRQGVSRQTQLRCQNYFAARELLKHSEQLLTLPRDTASRLLDESLHIEEVPIKLPVFVTNLYWHANSDNDPALSWLRDVISTQFTPQP